MGEDVKKRFGIGTIIGLLSVVLGVLAPVVWDLYKTKSALEVRAISNDTLVESPSEVKGLQISYGKEIIQRLSKSSFEIENTGRSPILAKDVVGKFEINISSSAQILNIVMDEMVPQNLGASAIRSGANTIEIVFPLLNPKDKFGFSLLTAGKDVSFDVNARIVGIKKIDVTNSPMQKASQRKPFPFVRHPFGTLFALIAFILSLSMFFEAGREKLLSLLATNGLLYLVTKSKASAISQLKPLLDIVQPDLRKSTYLILNTLDDSAFSSGAAQHKITDHIYKAAMRDQGTIYGALFFLGISLFGFWYAF